MLANSSTILNAGFNIESLLFYNWVGVKTGNQLQTQFHSLLWLLKRMKVRNNVIYKIGFVTCIGSMIWDTLGVLNDNNIKAQFCECFVFLSFSLFFFVVLFRFHSKTYRLKHCVLCKRSSQLKK